MKKAIGVMIVTGLAAFSVSGQPVPVPVYPPYGSATYQTIPYLQWWDVVSTPYAGNYQIQIGQNSSFSVVLDDDTIPAMINHYVPAKEFSPQTLYWRVRYIDEMGTAGNWSSTWKLTIQAMPAVVTVPLGSDWSAIQGYLSTALAKAPAELRFTPGTYNITRDTNDTDFLHIQNEGNILVNGQGCTFVITDQGGTTCDFFYGRSATGPIQFKNFTVDYAPDSLAQFGGKVIDIEYLTYPDCAFTVQVDPATYSALDPLLKDLTTGIFLEPESLQRWHALDADPRLAVNETWSQAAANSTHGPNTYRFTPASNKSAFYDHLVISNWFVTVERGGDLFYVYQSCPDLIINNVNSKACRGRAFIPRSDCARLRVVNNQILRTGNRALGMTSGGINDHSNLAPTDWFPWWEGNTLEYNADDMYNGNTDQCVFRNNVLRGPFRNAIWIHKNRQWVEGNTVIYAGTEGLSMDPGGLGATMCSVVNVGLIKNNTFIQPKITGLSMGSDLTLPLDESGDRYHTDITIEGNIWHNHLQYEGINISYAKRIIIRNNHIDSTGVPFTDVNDPSRAIGIHVVTSDAVQILTNEVWDPRIAPDKRIVVETDVTNLAVVPGPDATPPEMLHGWDGNVLRFSWPAKYWGWVAQSKYSLTDTQQWANIAGSQTNLDTKLNIAIDPIQPKMFYRLRQP